MKNHFALPMTGYLHMVQAYATEMSVHPEMAFWWTLALQKNPLVPSEFHTVRGAWRYVCRATQWNPSGSRTERLPVGLLAGMQRRLHLRVWASNGS